MWSHNFLGIIGLEKKSVEIRIEPCLLPQLIGYQNACLKKWINSRGVLKFEKLLLHHVDIYFSEYLYVEKKNRTYQDKSVRAKKPTLLTAQISSLPKCAPQKVDLFSEIFSEI